MDSPEIIKRAGGVLYGSESTVNVGRGADLGEESMTRISDGDTYAFGDFTVRVFEGVHSPGDKYPGRIDESFVPPTKASAYRTGGCYSFLFEHPTGTMLVHPSAHFVPNKFDGLDVDLLYLGIGTLGAQSAQFQNDYWQHTLEATRPDLVIPVHWDDFGRPLNEKLRPMPRLLDKFAKTKELLDRKSAESGVAVRFQKRSAPCQAVNRSRNSTDRSIARTAGATGLGRSDPSPARRLCSTWAWLIWKRSVSSRRRLQRDVLRSSVRTEMLWSPCPASTARSSRSWKGLCQPMSRFASLPSSSSWAVPARKRSTEEAGLL